MDVAAVSSTSSKTPRQQPEDCPMEEENVLMSMLLSSTETKMGLSILGKHTRMNMKQGKTVFWCFRAIGCGVILSVVSAFLINLSLSRKTLPPGKKASLLLPIYINNISKCKHGSDSGAYDSKGRFVSSKFEEIFSKHASSHPSALTGKELRSMLRENREEKDYRGWVGAMTEWEVLYYLCKDKDGLLHKDTIRGVYDGSLFYQMAQQKASRDGRKMD